MPSIHERADFLAVHYLLSRSFANGPGARFVLWTQGCSLGCPGCFNPLTHPLNPSRKYAIAELFTTIAAIRDRIEGITISGGEPLEQAAPLAVLLHRIKSETSLGVILFTGFSQAEVVEDASRSKVLPYVDAVVAGRFDRHRRVAVGLRGSENKEILLFTDRYKPTDFESVPTTELVIDSSGDLISTGISPVRPAIKVDAI